MSAAVKPMNWSLLTLSQVPKPGEMMSSLGPGTCRPWKMQDRGARASAEGHQCLFHVVALWWASANTLFIHTACPHASIPDLLVLDLPVSHLSGSEQPAKSTVSAMSPCVFYLWLHFCPHHVNDQGHH